MTEIISVGLQNTDKCLKGEFRVQHKLGSNERA